MWHEKQMSTKPYLDPDTFAMRYWRALKHVLGLGDETHFITDLLRDPARHIQRARKKDNPTLYTSRGECTLALVPGDLFLQTAVEALLWREAVALDPTLKEHVSTQSDRLKDVLRPALRAE
jgi:hypothetical protein